MYTLKGHMIASCDSCGVIKLWDFRKLLPIVSIDTGPSPGNDVNFDPSGRIFFLFNICNESNKFDTCSEMILFPLLFFGVFSYVNLFLIFY